MSKILRSFQSLMNKRFFSSESMKQKTQGLLQETLQNAKKFTKANALCLMSVAFGAGSTFLLYQVKTKENFGSKKGVRRAEDRFLRFASTEYKGQVYMSPSDFVDSLLLAAPKRGKRRRSILSDAQVKVMQEKTPDQQSRHKIFFSSLANNGIISYMEYLFLISILIKPLSMFEISFKLLDVDDNQTIDREEFKVIEKIFASTKKLKPNKESNPIRDEKLIDDIHGLQKNLDVDTTLTLHFFGSDGNDTLDYDTFKQFLLDVQSEIMHLEFTYFSHGLPFITELDFAKLLIKYTFIDPEYDYDNFIERLNKRSHNFEGISYKEYSSFINFLHRLEEFSLAIRYYNQINPEVSKFDFHDAFNMLPDHNLTWHLIDVVFNIFDVNGDGSIVYQDFMHAMNERLHRGFKTRRKLGQWPTFKKCVKRNRRRDPAVEFNRKHTKHSKNPNNVQQTKFSHLLLEN